MECEASEWDERAAWPLLVSVGLSLVLFVVGLIAVWPPWVYLVLLFVAALGHYPLRWRPRRRVVISQEGVEVGGRRRGFSEAKRLRFTDASIESLLAVLEEMSSRSRRILPVEVLFAIVKRRDDDRHLLDQAAWALVDIGEDQGAEGPGWHIELEGTRVLHSWVQGRGVLGEPERGPKRSTSIWVEVPTELLLRPRAGLVARIPLLTLRRS